MHFLFDLLRRFLNEDLLTITIRNHLKLLGLIRAPRDESVHEVSRVHSVVSGKGNHEPVIKGTGALHESVLLLLQHCHHTVDELTVHSRLAHLQDLLVLLAHLVKRFLELKLASELVVANDDYAEEH